MTKSELEALLKEFDEALVAAFPGPEPMSVLLVGGACLLLQGLTTQPADFVDVIIFEMLGSPERTLVFHSPTADKIRSLAVDPTNPSAAHFISIRSMSAANILRV